MGSFSGANWALFVWEMKQLDKYVKKTQQKNLNVLGVCYYYIYIYIYYES